MIVSCLLFVCYLRRRNDNPSKVTAKVGTFMMQLRQNGYLRLSILLAQLYPRSFGKGRSRQRDLKIITDKNALCKRLDSERVLIFSLRHFLRTILFSIASISI
jgi:hypothetical protein